MPPLYVVVKHCTVMQDRTGHNEMRYKAHKKHRLTTAQWKWPKWINWESKRVEHRGVAWLTKPTGPLQQQHFMWFVRDVLYYTSPLIATPCLCWLQRSSEGVYRFDVTSQLRAEEMSPVACLKQHVIVLRWAPWLGACGYSTLEYETDIDCGVIWLHLKFKFRIIRTVK